MLTGEGDRLGDGHWSGPMLDHFSGVSRISKQEGVKEKRRGFEGGGGIGVGKGYGMVWRVYGGWVWRWVCAPSLAKKFEFRSQISGLWCILSAFSSSVSWFKCDLICSVLMFRVCTFLHVMCMVNFGIIYE